MAANLLRWVTRTRRTYLGNATAVRDYRVQLRGNRAVWLWTIYLIILIFVALAMYVSTVSDGEKSLVDAQESLRVFYMYVMGMLAGIVMLVSPSLAATSIVSERQRQSLDLVFSAPVTPKYYLVGKMISSYRYVWILLILSLPITAMCVLLGGATWVDVIHAYILFSLHGLVYTALALAVSAYSQRPGAALVQSYIFVGILCGLGGAAAATTFGSGYMSMATGRSSMAGEMAFGITLSPYGYIAGSTYTNLFGVTVPNWVLFAIIALMLTKIFLLGAASAMSGRGATDTKVFRILAPIYGGLICYGIGSFFTLATGIGGISGMLGTSQERLLAYSYGLALNWSLLLVLGIFAPFIVCFGLDEEKKFWPDGMLRVSRVFYGSPSGAWPYLMTIIATLIVGIAFGTYDFKNIHPTFWAYVMWAVGFWTFVWGIGRLTSSWNTGLRSARVIMVVLIVASLAMPLVVLSMFQVEFTSAAWNFILMRSLIGGPDDAIPDVTFIQGAVLFCGGMFLAQVAESKVRALSQKLSIQRRGTIQ